jgi:hypothetical protein
MVAFISRVLTIFLVAYSFFELKAKVGINAPGTQTASAARLLFGIEILVTIVFFVIPFFPETVHFGTRRLSDYSPEQLERIMPQVRDLLALMGCIFALFFSVNVHLLIGQALSPDPRAAARAIVALEPWLVGGMLAALGAITFYYLRRFDAATNSDSTPNDTVED